MQNIYQIFINSMIRKGKKIQSYNRFLSLLKFLKVNFNESSNEIFLKACENVRLLVFIYRKKIGGSLYQIPLYLNDSKKMKKGFISFFKVIESKKQKTLSERINFEFFDLYLNKGLVINNRNSIYVNAIDNRTNLKYVRSKIKNSKTFSE